MGFIRKLPTQLVESFKSTLDEVREADLLVHVVDISHSNFEEQIEVVDQTLKEILKGENKPSILVFNKIDAFTFVPKDEDDLSPMTKENISLEQLQQTWMARLGNGLPLRFGSRLLGCGFAQGPPVRASTTDTRGALSIQRFPISRLRKSPY